MTRLLYLSAAVLLGAWVLGVVGLGVGEAVPDRWVADRLHTAVSRGVITNTSQHQTRQGNISDHFTECISLSIGMGERADSGFFETLAESPNLGPCDELVPAVTLYGSSGSLPQGPTYLRYWHGYAALTRPAIALVGVAGLRMIAFLSLVASMLLLGKLVSGVSGRLAAVALLGPLVATSDLLELPQSATQTLALSVGFLGAAMVLGVSISGLTAGRVWFASLAAGAAFAYVDLLTVVPGTWILPAALAVLAARVDGRAVWSIFGYGGMWFGKWVFAATVMGPSRVFDDVRTTIGTRISGESVYAEGGFGSGVRANVDYWFSRPLTPAIFALSVVLVAALIIVNGRKFGWSAQILSAVAAAPALVPLLWFEILSNHSQIHHWFTYRSLPLALGVVLLAVVTPTPPGGQSPIVRR